MDYLRERLPGVYITCSSEELPQMGEYKRFSTTVISACLGPIVKKYLTSLEAELKRLGFAGQLLIVQCNQYLQSVPAIIDKPVYLNNSGPSAGPVGAVRLGEQIGELERAGEAERYLFGFEESYGYLSGPHVRDKDAVNAALLCCEMAAWYRAQGMTLAQAMDALYEKFGYYRNELQSVVLPGEDGMERMSAILTALRAAPPHTLAGERVTRVRDYLGGLDGLPASDVLELRTAHVKVIVRPSGTEPKLKLYYSAHARTMAEAAALCAAARRDMSARLGE